MVSGGAKQDRTADLLLARFLFILFEQSDNNQGIY